MNEHPAELESFIHNVDAIVSKSQDRAKIVETVRPLMQQLISTDFLPDKYRTPCNDGYARNLMHRSSHGYVLITMVWCKGQGTSIHDHDGTWGVVGVYEGQVRVEDYEVIEENGDWADMRMCKSILAGKGNLGYIVKEDERHTIGNAQDEKSISIHCYGKVSHRSCRYAK